MDSSILKMLNLSFYEELISETFCFGWKEANFTHISICVLHWVEAVFNHIPTSFGCIWLKSGKQKKQQIIQISYCFSTYNCVKIFLNRIIFQCIMKDFATGYQMSASVTSVLINPLLLSPNDLCALPEFKKALILAAQMKWTTGVNTPDVK